jgi:hypothetical protein
MDPEVVDGGHNLQIWRVAIITLNIQSWTIKNEDGPLAWVLGQGLTTFQCKKN